MKQKLLLLLTAAMLSLLPFSAHAANVITLTTSKAVGKTICLNIKASGTVTLTGVSEAYTVGNHTYTLTGQTVTITGDVTYLDCSSDRLTALDVSHNAALTELDCYSNQLTALDVSHNTAFTFLNCTDNRLTALDVTKLTALKTLGCAKNQLTALDVSHNTALAKLMCYTNLLAALDMSHNTALTELWCYGNQFRDAAVMDALIASLPDRTGTDAGTFTVASEDETTDNRNTCTPTQVAAAKARNWNSYSDSSPYFGFTVIKDITMTTAKAVGQTIKLNIKATGTVTITGVSEDYEAGEKTYTLLSQTVTIAGNVRELVCEGNQLTSLNLERNRLIEKLDCSSNSLTALDVRNNVALFSLTCYGNQFKGATMDALINSLIDLYHTFAGRLIVTSDHETDANRNTITTAQVAAAKFLNWTCYNLKNDGDIVEMIGNVITMNTSRAVGENVIFDINANGKVTIAGVSEYYTAGAMAYTLTAQTVTLTGDITMLDCNNNDLTALDVSKNTALNSLTCYGNKIRGTNMDALIASLVNRTGSDAGTFVVASVQETADNRNSCTPAQVAAAKAKNWNCYFLDHHETLVDYAGVLNVITLTTAKAAGSQITLNIRASGTVAITGVSEAYTAGEKTYTLTGQTVTLTGDVTELTCAGNSLSSIDVSKNLLLTELRCQNNNLSQLDLSSNPWLDVLYCYGNRIGGKKMDALIASLPDQSSSALGAVLRAVDKDNAYEGNTFTVPNVNAANEKKWIVRTASGSSLGLTEGVAYLTTSAAVGETMDLYVESTNSLTYDGLIFDNDEGQYPTYDITSQDIYLLGNITILYCDDSPTTKLDVSNVVTLQHLSCRNTSITSLDVTKNTALLSLNYGGTGIHTPVDVSQNTNLQTLSCQGDELTTLDVSKNTKLTTLYCDGNQLQSLDVTKNTRLQTLQCYGNHLQGAQMDALIASLVDRTGTTAGKIIVACDDETDANRNVCTTAQVAAAKAKNWSCYISDTYGNLSDYAGSEPTGISNVQTDGTGDVPAAIYDLSGRRIQQMRHGVNIVRMSNGRTRKVIK